MEPIFEADFEDCSYGFRPERNAHQALEKIRENLRAGKCEIYDADLEGYFDPIPHDKLMACVRMRVIDGSVLKLIRQWLEAPVVEEDQAGRKKIGRNRSGTPQGGVLSPLLANIYLHWFDRVFQSKSGPAHWAKATLIRYADDFVVMARHLSPRIRDFIEQKGGMAGVKAQSPKDPDSESTPEPRALRVPWLGFRDPGANKATWFFVALGLVKVNALAAGAICHSLM